MPPNEPPREIAAQTRTKVNEKVANSFGIATGDWRHPSVATPMPLRLGTGDLVRFTSDRRYWFPGWLVARRDGRARGDARARRARRRGRRGTGPARWPDR